MTRYFLGISLKTVLRTCHRIEASYAEGNFLKEQDSELVQRTCGQILAKYGHYFIKLDGPAGHLLV